VNFTTFIGYRIEYKNALHDVIKVSHVKIDNAYFLNSENSILLHCMDFETNMCTDVS
jgi:hypothetical protein